MGCLAVCFSGVAPHNRLVQGPRGFFRLGLLEYWILVDDLEKALIRKSVDSFLEALSYSYDRLSLELKNDDSDISVHSPNSRAIF